MAEHHLDGAEVGTAFEQVRGERVADHMRAERRADTGGSSVRPQDLPEPDPAERSAAAVDEHAFTRRAAAVSMARQDGSGVTQITRDPLGRLIAERNQPFLAALSNACQVVGFKVYVGSLHIHELRHSHAGRIEEFEHRTIAQAKRSSHVGLSQERLHLVGRKALRKRRPRLWRTEIVGRILDQVLLQRHESIEATNGGDRACDRPRREAAGHLPPHEDLEVLAIEGAECTAFRLSEPCERLEVAAVAFQCVVRQPALDAKMVEVVANLQRVRWPLVRDRVLARHNRDIIAGLVREVY